MSGRTKYLIGVVAVAVITLLLLPNWIAGVIILGLLAAPVVGYLMLDPSQRRRLRRIGGKSSTGKSIGH